MSQIKFFPLGGLDERDKNLYVIECEDGIFIFNCGFKTKAKGHLGVEIIIPDFSYLVENKHRIKGIFLTDPSVSNAGALPYLFDSIKAPIYLTKFSKYFLKATLSAKQYKKILNNFVEIDFKTIYQLGNEVIEPVQMFGSLPNSTGYILYTKQGAIVFAGTYVFDAIKSHLYDFDIHKLAGLATKTKILALIANSNQGSRLDYTAPHYKVFRKFEVIIKESRGKILVVLYSNDFYKLIELLSVLRHTQRKVAFYQPAWNKLFNVLQEEKLFSAKNINFVSLSEAAADPRSVIIMNNFNEKIYEEVIKLVTEETDSITLGKDDTIVAAAPPVVGNELMFAAFLDELARTEIKTISISAKETWSIQPSSEDIKLLTRLVSPKFFIPVNGLYRNLSAARIAAIQAGVKSDNVLMVDNGQITIFEDQKIVPTSDIIKATNVFVDETSLSSVSAVVLSNRERLLRDGVAILGFDVRTVNDKLELASLIDIQMRGVVIVKTSAELFEALTSLVKKEIEKINVKLQPVNPTNFKKMLKEKVQNIIGQKAGKSPMIMIAVNFLH